MQAGNYLQQAQRGKLCEDQARSGSGQAHLGTFAPWLNLTEGKFGRPCSFVIAAMLASCEASRTLTLPLRRHNG